MSRRLTIPFVALLAAALVAGCGVTKQETMLTQNDSLVVANPLEQGEGTITPEVQPEPGPAPAARRSRPARSRTAGTAPRRSTSSSALLPGGTPVAVTVQSTLSSKTAGVGDSWTGVTSEPVYVGGRLVVPSGSPVRGTVVVAQPAERGERATLQLGLSSITVNGRVYRVRGSSREFRASSTRTRNVGAVAAGTAAGAIIGRAVGGSGKGALIGGITGAAATTGAVAASKGYQVTLKPGTQVTFTTRSA